MAGIAGFVYRLGLGIWTGAMAYMTFVATPAIFAHLPRAQAAAAVAAIFPPTIRVGWAAATVLLASAVVLWRARPRRTLLGEPSGGGALLAGGRLAVLLTAAMLALSLYGGLVIFPKAENLRRQIPSFEAESPARAEFRRLHGVASALNLAVLSCGAVLLVMQAAADARRR